MSFYRTQVNNLPTYIRYSIAGGAVVGLGLTYVLFQNVGWYHDLVVLQWTNPWMLLGGTAVGAAIAVATD